MAFAYGKNLNNTASRQSVILAPIGAADVVFNISAGDGASFPPYPFSARLTDQFDQDDYDLILVTDVTGDTITCDRNYGGTTAADRDVGDRFTLEVTAEDIGPQFFLRLAAFNAPQHIKDASWAYSLDGLDDGFMIQAAIDEIEARQVALNPIGTRRGVIDLSVGSFVHAPAAPVAAPIITIPETPPAPDDLYAWRIVLRGQGVHQTFLMFLVDSTNDLPIIDCLAHRPNLWLIDMSMWHDPPAGFGTSTGPLIGSSNKGTDFYDGVYLHTDGYSGLQY